MKLLIIVAYFFTQAVCVELKLPLKYYDRFHFYIQSSDVNHTHDSKMRGVIFKHIDISSINSQSITKVFYNEYLLYEVPEYFRPQYKRVVRFNEFRGRVFISVKQEGLSEYDAYYYIANDVIYNLIKLSSLINETNGKIDGMTPGMFVITKMDLLTEENGPYYGLNIIRNVKEIVRSPVYVLSLTIRHDIDKIFERDIVKKENPYDPVFDREYFHSVVEN